MTGTVSPTIPTIGQPNATEDPNVRSALVTLRDALNAVLTSGNILDGAQLSSGSVPNSALAAIAPSKISGGTSGKLIVGNASNNFAAVTPSGDIAVSNTGALTIPNATVDTAMLADGAVTNQKLDLTVTSDTLATTVTLTNSYQTLCSVAVASSRSYLVMGSVSLHQGTPSLGGTIGATKISLTYNGSEHETDEIDFGGAYCFAINFPAVITSGTNLLVKAKDSGSGTISARGADAAGGYTPTRIMVVRYT